MILLYSQNYEDQVVCGFIVNTRRLSLFFVCLLSHTLRAQVISHQFRVMGMRRCNTFKFFREKHCCCKNIHANIVIVNMSFCQTKYFFLDKNIYTLMILNTKLFCMQTPALVPCMLKLLFYLHHFNIY